jgi:hypothetical protein
MEVQPGRSRLDKLLLACMVPGFSAFGVREVASGSLGVLALQALRSSIFTLKRGVCSLIDTGRSSRCYTAVLTAPHISQELQCDARIGHIQGPSCGSGRSRTDTEIARRLGLLNLPNPRIRRRLGESEWKSLNLQTVQSSSSLTTIHRRHLQRLSWWPSTPYSCVSAFVRPPHSFALTYSHSLPSRLVIDPNNTPERLALALCAARLRRFTQPSTPSNMIAMQ